MREHVLLETTTAVCTDDADSRSSSNRTFDIELSPTESGGHGNGEEEARSSLHYVTEANTIPPLFRTARPYDMIISCDNSDDENSEKPTGVLSQRILQAVRHHQLQRALQERNAKCSVRRVFAVLVGITPIMLFGWSLMVAEERDDNCKSLLCLLGAVEEETYFGFVAVCGGFGALLYSSEFWNYSLARWVGGCVSALGSILTIWTVSQTMSPSDHLAVIVALMCMFLGLLGALPGLLFYYVIKIGIDECFASEEDCDDEYAALTVNLQASASYV
jgi:hypothetical protein